ncbi:conserved exported hypothetical protein [uncultured Eubacteriales bacterium]|uniref:Uncharacterized protein n=1 Tax=uncultured Eubacteriales bacterium TaxID=172733 RepID=A0A212J9X2_9FIRM|nr:conserved exported hypothetical protein [uncultured Eubacteriales bacterium]
MNMKKLSLAALSLTLSVGLLAGCAGGNSGASATPSATPAATPSTSASDSPSASTPASGDAVKTGLSVITSVADSKNASADGDGLAQANIALVAVTVDDAGVIDGCVIDMVQSKINFDTAGALTTDAATTFLSKDELGDDYGMRKASSISKEWNEQATAFAEYAVGKTVDELKGIAVTEKGAPSDADLAASVTLSVGDFISGIEAAVNNATSLGAQKGDKLGLASSTNMESSKNASADGDGLAQAYATIAAVTTNGDTITSCVIDAVQANVNFDTTGAITTDLAAAVASKDELGDDYGMRKASAIGKEWNEQAAGFAAYVTGKTVSDVTGIAVNEKGAATDTDLAASVTVGIGDFQAVVAKAAG